MRRQLLVLAAALAAAGNAWQLAAAKQQPDSECQGQMYTAFAGSALFKSQSWKLKKWVDPQTPASQCKKELYGDELQLVFSDEFNGKDRSLAAGAQDPKWTAEDMYYFPTRDLEVYKPSQVKVTGGSAVVTIEKGITSAESQQPNGDVWKISKVFKSGFVSGWNKFLFTGGYLETSVRLPGNGFYPGFWPAVWMMGNLGRAGYMETTAGFWPYSYSTCEGSQANAWSDLPGQNISACRDPKGFNRTHWGMAEGIGRGAPEIDLLEVRVNPTNDGTPDAPGPGYKPPQVSQTLQMAPLMPPGKAYDPAGLFYPGSSSKYKTQQNPWPGNKLQNSISAVSDLSESFYTDFHTFGVDWEPHNYMRWFIDGVKVFEITEAALKAVTSPSGDYLGPREIPVEPMYIIFNLAMSEDFSGYIDLKHLQFPSQMHVDYIRVYQRTAGQGVAYNVGPNGTVVGTDGRTMPTEQYIACHRKKYITRKSDNVLITAPCNGAAGRAALLGVGALLALGLLAVL